MAETNVAYAYEAKECWILLHAFAILPHTHAYWYNIESFSTDTLDKTTGDC